MVRKATVQVVLLTALVVGCAGAWTAVPATAEPKAPEKFTTFCVPCHGSAGDGNGPAAAFLNPKPRNLTDGKYMNVRTDAQLINVIKNGSASEKFSPLMSGFGGVLNDMEIKDIVAYIRLLAVPKYQSEK
ncbi:cytochrome C class I [Candidatus Methylomirabilis limnetica]|jgi:cytochrome c553|uniref:Cytochrome C class I n=1 Tax=Candidatus Methylomirabilis limnetica TaxID=2033718 RepID=A0A2T4TVV2_9BACT|nr:cytochrome c [Candidatus Methylomirabilis limnetica]PTL35240.1 cytochrome C class I [Candidatus Methylomirabilis limnetica]